MSFCIDFGDDNVLIHTSPDLNLSWGDLLAIGLHSSNYY